MNNNNIRNAMNFDEILETKYRKVGKELNEINFEKKRKTKRM